MFLRDSHMQSPTFFDDISLNILPLYLSQLIEFLAWAQAYSQSRLVAIFFFP